MWFWMRFIKFRISKLFKPSTKEDKTIGLYNLISKYDGNFKRQVNQGYTIILSKLNLKISSRGIDSSDIDVLNQVFLYKEYKFIEEYKKIFTENKINILDAGANIGASTLYMSRLFPNAEIISIEPDTENFKQLCKNIELNSVNAIPENVALWYKKELLNIAKDFRDGKEWALTVVPDSQNGFIKAFTVDELMRKYKWDSIDIFKMDIEGAEKDILLNPFYKPEFLNKVNMILIEIHPEIISFDDASNILISYNFKTFKDGDLLIGLSQGQDY